MGPQENLLSGVCDKEQILIPASYRIPMQMKELLCYIAANMCLPAAPFNACYSLLSSFFILLICPMIYAYLHAIHFKT